MEDLKNKVESILFAVGTKISVDEVAKLCNSKTQPVLSALKSLQKEYKDKDSSLVVLDEGKNWHLTVREKYLDLVQAINPHTELSRTVMETLAVIAWKQPILQSEVIKIRTNKAYEHIDMLEEASFISKKKQGRSYTLRITQKFFDYFDLKGERDVRNLFKNLGDMPAQKKMGDLNVKHLGDLEVVKVEQEKHVVEDKGVVGDFEVYEEKGGQEEEKEEPEKQEREEEPEEEDKEEPEEKPEEEKDIPGDEEQSEDEEKEEPDKEEEEPEEEKDTSEDEEKEEPEKQEEEPEQEETEEEDKEEQEEEEKEELWKPKPAKKQKEDIYSKSYGVKEEKQKNKKGPGLDNVLRRHST